MNKILTSAIIAIAAQSACAEAPATKDFYIYPHYTYYNYDDIDNTSIDSGDRFGISLGMNMDSNWSAELSWDSVDSESSGFDVDTTLIQLNALYSFNTDSNLQPMLFAGIGHTKNSLDFTPSETADGTSVDLGAGLKYAFNDVVGLRADIRAVHTFDYSANDMMATVGITFGFGGGSSSKAAAIVDGDSDNDGITDSKDNCPGTTAGASVDNNGCELDSDNDGIADSIDKCTATPEGAAVDANGCAKDSDNDGVADYKDQCNDTAAGVAVDETGCNKVLTETVSITLSLSFANDSANIKPEFAEQIANVASFMKQHPDTNVMFEGFSDSVGDAGYNKQLSERRAQAVANSLINDHNIESSRVSAVGYGEENPVADNSTAEGRKANRRVIAKISATAEKSE